MAQLTLLMAGLLFLVESQASEKANRSTLKGFLSKYMPSGSDVLRSSMSDYDKFITPKGAEALSNRNDLAEPGPNMGVSPFTIVDDKPVLHPTAQVQGPMAFTAARVEPSISSKDFNPPTIADRQEMQAVQKLVTNDSNRPITLSAVCIGLLSLATMLGVRLQRGLRPATVLASGGGLGPLMPMNTASALGDTVMEMQSQDPIIDDSAPVLDTRPAHQVQSIRVGWGQLSSQNSRPLSPARASAYKDNLGREVSEERIEMLKKMGYVYDEDRQTWTKPPRGRPKRRPALARALSARILEVRIADEASETEAKASRAAAEKLQEVVRQADNEADAMAGTPREALESLGRELAFRPVVGPLALSAAQLALWASVRPNDAVLGDAFVNRADVWAAVPGGYFALTTCALFFGLAAADVRASATPWFGRVAGALEATAADGAAGALGPSGAPRAWRASDLKWRSVAQALEFAASGPRVAALHGGLQVALVESARALQPAPIDSTGESLATLTGIASVALFAFVTEAFRTNDDDNVLRAENAAVRASLKSKDGDDVLHRTICLAWLDSFPDPPASGRALPPLGAAVRAASAGSAFALTNGDLLAPILLHGAAGVLAAAAPLSPDPDDVPDPDRAVVTVGGDGRVAVMDSSP